MIALFARLWLSASRIRRRDWISIVRTGQDGRLEVLVLEVKILAEPTWLPWDAMESPRTVSTGERTQGLF